MIKNNDIQSTFENIKSYFETYVKTYKPYKDNPVFKSILETLIDTYYKHLYLDVPKDLLNLVVKNIITPRINVDYVLVEIGLPEELIQKMTIVEKWIFFQIFADFMRYKSTIQFFQVLSEVSQTSFPQKFNIYELWIDRNDNGNWVFRPIPIYQSETIDDVSVDDISYDDIYDRLPTLLISKDQLQNWFNDNRLILPLKSNLILLRQYEITDVAEVSGLVRVSFLNSFGNYLINLYFTDKSYVTKLQFVDKLWYYLLVRCYNFEQLEKDLTNIILISQQNPNVPDISQVQTIIQEHQNINSWSEYLNFYHEYLEPFITPNYHQTNVTASTLYDNLYTEDPELMTYINDRINNADDLKAEIVTIMDEIYSSLLLSIIDYTNQQYYQEFLPIYLNTLSKIFVDIDISSLKQSKAFVAKVVLTLKPFHTDIIFQAFRAVRSQDREYFEDLYGFAMEINSASIMSISTDVISISRIERDDSFPFISTALYSFYKNTFVDYNIDMFEVFKLLTQINPTIMLLYSNASSISHKDSLDSLSLVSIAKAKISNREPPDMYLIDDSEYYISIE